MTKPHLPDSLRLDADERPADPDARPSPQGVHRWSVERGAPPEGYLLSLHTDTQQKFVFRLEAMDLMSIADAVLNDRLVHGPQPPLQ